MARKIVLLAGDWADPVWTLPRAWIELRATCHYLDQPAGGDDHLNPPAAVVWAQARPGEVAVEHLARFPPSERSVPALVLAGPWCEGELRAGTQLPHSIRIEWSRWQGGLEAELEPLLAPLTATTAPRHALSPETQLIARTLRSVKQTKANVARATICTDRLPLYESLADALRQFRIRSQRPMGATNESFGASQLVLYDGWPQVARWLATSPLHPLHRLLLLNWPRPADVDRAAKLGFHQVIPLPFRLSEIASALSSLPAPFET